MMCYHPNMSVLSVFLCLSVSVPLFLSLSLSLPLFLSLPLVPCHLPLCSLPLANSLPLLLLCSQVNAMNTPFHLKKNEESVLLFLIPFQLWKEDSIRKIPGGFKFKSNTFTLQQSSLCGWYSSFLTKESVGTAELSKLLQGFLKVSQKMLPKAFQHLEMIPHSFH